MKFIDINVLTRLRKEITAEIGHLEDLNTTDKTNIVAAINEIRSSSEVKETAHITLTSNLGSEDSDIIGATVIVHDDTLDVDVFNGTWQGEAIVAKITPLSNYTITVGSVQGYATPASQSYSSGISNQRDIVFTYNTQALTVSISSNQSDDETIAALTASISYTYAGNTHNYTPSNGDVVKVPTGVTPTVTFPDVSGYTKEVVGTTALYKTGILTVTFSQSGEGGSNDDLQAASGGATATIAFTDGDGSSVSETVSASTSLTHTRKIPFGNSVTVTFSDVEFYVTPESVTVSNMGASGATASGEYAYNPIPADVVDLGLPSGRLWCSHNVGATNPEDTGLYFSWGNTDGHAKDSGYDFSSSNYSSSKGKNLTANIPSGSTTYDAATVNQGGSWRMPTKEEFQELYDNTDTEWTTVNGVAGRKFKKKSDASVFIFLPAAGYYSGTSLNGFGSGGFYWSSSWYSSSFAYYLGFDSSDVNPQNSVYRRCGFSVRAVQ